VRRNLWLDAFPGPRLSGADAPAHEFERFQHLAAYLGIADTDTAPRLVIDDTALAGVEAQLDQRRPLAGLAIGAVHPKRQWPGERYGQVAAALLDSGVTPVLLGSPGEASIARDVTAALSSPDAVVDLVGKVAPRGIPALLRRCELFVGNDSGLGHIAAAVGTPTVTISCHPRGAPESHFNAPERYRPWITPGIVVRPAQAACAECQDGCVWHAPPCCIAAVPAADVIEACREVAAFVP
jgi:heptosyltransferase-2